MAATLGRKHPADACAKGEESGSDSSREAVFRGGENESLCFDIFTMREKIGYGGGGRCDVMSLASSRKKVPSY